MSKTMQTRTIATVQLEIHDNQPYGPEWTAGQIMDRARTGALKTLAELNRANLRIVGTPKVAMVITLREFCVIESQDDGVAIIAHLDAKAAIDSAELGEVETIKSRFDGGTAGENILQTVRDIGTLLAIVQRQEYEALESCGAHEEKALALSRANAEIVRLTERLRTMQHGEAEALKMMGAEKQRADRLPDEVLCAALRLADSDKAERKAKKPDPCQGGGG